MHRLSRSPPVRSRPRRPVRGLICDQGCGRCPHVACRDADGNLAHERAAMTERKAVLLDMQGTLGGDGLGDVRNFAFYPFAYAAIRLLNQLGLPAIVVTNQSHIATGEFTLDDFSRRIEALRQDLAQHGAVLDRVYCCPRTEEDVCVCKKPRPGLLHQAAKDLDLDLSRGARWWAMPGRGTSSRRGRSDARPSSCSPG